MRARIKGKRRYARARVIESEKSAWGRLTGVGGSMGNPEGGEGDMLKVGRHCQSCMWVGDVEVA
jgi:hypothetical protein